MKLNTYECLSMGNYKLIFKNIIIIFQLGPDSGIIEMIGNATTIE